MPDTPDTRKRLTDNAVTIGLALAGVVAVLILVGSVFNAGEKSTDLTTTQPSTESPATGDTKTP